MNKARVGPARKSSPTSPALGERLPCLEEQGDEHVPPTASEALARRAIKTAAADAYVCRGARFSASTAAAGPEFLQTQGRVCGANSAGLTAESVGAKEAEMATRGTPVLVAVDGSPCSTQPISRAVRALTRADLRDACTGEMA